MYYGAEGNSPKEKNNSIRRAQYQLNKDYINAQKRDAYQTKRLTEENLKPSSKEGSIQSEETNATLTTAYYGIPDGMRDLPKIKGNPKKRIN